MADVLPTVRTSAGTDLARVIACELYGDLPSWVLASPVTASPDGEIAVFEIVIDGRRFTVAVHEQTEGEPEQANSKTEGVRFAG